jgi:hypothetical protein
MVLHFGHNQNTLQKCIIKDSACALFGHLKLLLPNFSPFTYYLASIKVFTFHPSSSNIEILDIVFML